MTVETGAARKFQRVRLIQRYLINPPMKLLVWAGLLPDHALLETRGRKTGKRRVAVVAVNPEGRTLWVISEHGPRAGYVANLSAQPRIRVRYERKWHAATATPLPDDDVRKRLAELPQESTRKAIERFHTSLLTIRIDLED
ncbi:nitroreductase family deazaflavin-dependent oxidoreductase [Nocardia seriolae]|uniref:Uncharacterized protein n=1 Tax=Nocardia seriolae TaxID=37332 RepID=A0A0B8NCF8_9NOCA|nr:nitroreductase family deazaflavin-dependent oxidoreductase [Nocardia seriolae]APA95959.1 hypothetical protein NS506_01891 [Nocardia seriolae]MTJ65945.1 nitroreductase family deazaflavin-dependent oxidoreductase [Nocardia seriolae]MTJ73183.1 nitroreductase family deazaflavin-dependent oxidoreductase [Nocardia seriolae]MTJ86129.1 nitroreductase family deazaflavin-dependent oxidoreductase [Nocardia seriolae]MTK30125.1 nitroreductase family deazaflavin-dependent oxidoreductase [Nocardia seriola